MPDIFTKAKRSEVMSLIKGRGNKDTEVAFAKLLRAHAITGWRRHLPIIGRPDFTFRRQRVVIFIDGCFWHGCPKHATMPKGNRPFWKKKFARNQARDRLVTRTLRKAGWRVLRIWEHELARRHQARCMRRVERVLTTEGSIHR